MNSIMNVSSDHLFLSNRFRMYLWHEVRNIRRNTILLTVATLPFWMLWGMWLRDGIIFIFPMFFLINSTPESWIDNVEKRYLLPISDNRLALYDIQINYFIIYLRFLFVFSLFYTGALITNYFIPHTDNFWIINIFDNPIHTYLRILIYGLIICWVQTSMSCPSFELSPQKLIWNIIFVFVIVQYAYMHSSYYWIVLTLIIPVIWAGMHLRQAWREGELNSQRLSGMALAGLVLLALGLTLPPFKHDLSGWNLLVACEVIFLMLSPYVIAPMNVRRFRHT